jgi:ornithine carbamoyltransferase
MPKKTSSSRRSTDAPGTKARTAKARTDKPRTEQPRTPAARPPAARTSAARPAAKATGASRAGASVPALTLSRPDLLAVAALSIDDVHNILRTAAAIKAARGANVADRLSGRAVAMIFEKASLRTRMSFEVGIARMGGHPIFYDLGASGDRIGLRESVRDFARNMERFVDMIIARVYSQAILEEVADEARIPVINALSDDHHPCQGLADALTITEKFGTIRGTRVCYIGDGNNVCVSLLESCCKLGGHVTIICPEGYTPPAELIARAQADADLTGGSITVTADARAVRGQQVVYTDCWVSMHHAAPAGHAPDAGGGDPASRVAAFAAYQVNDELMDLADTRAIFMHCLPAHRGEEVTDSVIDGRQSAVYDQAENRRWAQMAVMLGLLKA